MDHQIFHAINSWAGRSPILDGIGIFFGVYLIYIFVAGLLVFAIKDYRRNFWLAASSAIVSRILVVEAIKQLVNRPRPYEILNANLLVVDTEKGLSFTSGHTVILFSITFSFYGTKYFYPFLVLATLGSVARIFIGVHYPSDVIASIAIAFLVVAVIREITKDKAFQK